jgi:hypothetical protein
VRTPPKSFRQLARITLVALVVISTLSTCSGGTDTSGPGGTQNPVPSISSIAPNTAVVGASKQTVTITGSGFLTSSTVTFSGNSRPPTFVSANQLTITLEAANLSVYGSYSVRVTNPSPGGGTSDPQTFTVVPKPIVAFDTVSGGTFTNYFTMVLPLTGCRVFNIHNVGPQGSIMDYVVADDGPLAGFLNIRNALGNSFPSTSAPNPGIWSGTLGFGPGTTGGAIAVSVLPQFQSDTSLVGATIGINVYTPQASNFIKTPIFFQIVNLPPLQTSC